VTRLGAGGMGEVRRVFDQKLGRQVAMKLIRWDRSEDASVSARFLEEARITAQLQHPGIVAVYDQGQLEDGRLGCTMREVEGRTFDPVIAEVHAAVSAGRFMTSTGGYTLRRLVDVFARACEAVAYAHAGGVVHRDLKPANIMVGEHGEVLVVDWGI